MFTILRNLLVVALGLVVVASVEGHGYAQTAAMQRFERGTLAIKTAETTQRFRIEIARTPRQHSLGLMFRRRLAADAGMLFLYPRPHEIQMWMKNTFIPLDMVFIRGDGRIVSIVERTVPRSLETISSGVPATAVLEINAGTAGRLKLRVGDRVIHPAFGGPG